MSAELLEIALSFFPQNADRRGKEWQIWRERVDDLRQYLLSLKRSDRIWLWQSAQDRIRDRSFRGLSFMRLWFFSHASFDVFEDFIADALVCRAFADYLETVAICRNKKNRVSRKRIKRLTDVQQSEARFLAVRYASLLARHADGLFGYFQTATRRGNSITLIPEPETSEKSLRELLKKTETNLLVREVNRLNAKYPPVTSADLFRIFSLGPSQSRALQGNDVEGLLDDLIPELSLSNFVLATPNGWMPINAIEAAIGKVVSRGRWLKFDVAERPALAIKDATEVVPTIDQELFEQIARVHLSETNRFIGRMRALNHGLLPVGLKIHCADQKAPGFEFLTRGYFAAHNAGTCYNLPPVGSTDAACEMLWTIAEKAGVSYLDNPDFQIQVCSPGELDCQGTALLGVAFYLGSDTIRRYGKGNLVTTHSTGDRIVIYGAGVVDQAFEWWEKNPDGSLKVGRLSNRLQNRTDVLTCSSMRDIENVNLAATLLMHAQYNGFWRALGEQFIADMKSLLDRHQLSGLLNVLWANNKWQQTPKDMDLTGEGFARALEELSDYAFEEVARINAAYERGEDAGQQGILFEMQEMLRHYREEIEFQSPQTAR